MPKPTEFEDSVRKAAAAREPKPVTLTGDVAAGTRNLAQAEEDPEIAGQLAELAGPTPTYEDRRMQAVERAIKAHRPSNVKLEK